jgi:hypothetical protein
MTPRCTRGMSLVDVIVGTALMLVLFLALFGVLRASLMLSAIAKAKSGATAVAEVQMEYLHSLTYANLGTVGGIPSGVVTEDATTTEDGIDYAVHTFISYVDDPADGTGVNDTNGITTDYKRARIAVSYAAAGTVNSVVLVSNFAPPGLETTNGGGTLAIDVVDATGAPVGAATVHITNTALSPAVDLTTDTNAAGQVFLPGAATSTEYQVAVSKSGYSSAQTYARDATNQNPNPGYLTVAASQTTTQTFAIDRLALLTLATLSPIATSTFSDAFANTSKLASMSSTTVTDGTLALVSGATSGSARSVATTSAYLASWGALAATTNVPSGTSLALHVYDASGALVPDTVLPGNATGFTAFPVALEGISTSTYPSLAIGATFTGSGSATPSLSAWSLSYTAGPTPLPGVSVTLTGTKTIGSEGNGTPIYKTVVTATTGSDGTQGFSLEWDSYSLTVPNYDVEDACPSPPYALAPGSTTNAMLFLGAPSTNYLRVLVTDSAGASVPNAQVTLARTGYTETVSTSVCGSAYFGHLSAATDFTVTIAKSGYTTTSFTGVAVSGATVYDASFP